MTNPPLILASESRHRAALLKAVGLAFEARGSGVDEQVIKEVHLKDGKPAQDLAMTLARAKAETVSKEAPGAMVLGGDQVLLCQGQVFDKPRDLGEAAEHLRFFAGKTHTLETAAALVKDGELLWQCLTRPRLTMRVFSESFLEDYLARAGEVLLTSVGAYQIEGLGLQLFDKVEGDTFSIQGLPLIELLKFLRQQGLVAE